MYISTQWQETTFIMNGGEISRNIAINDGGGIASIVYGGELWSDFRNIEINGGEIIGNTAGIKGGGVRNEHGGRFTMTGGKISENTASLGGGISSGGGIEADAMTGGEIAYNTATQNGGGVYVEFWRKLPNDRRKD